MMSKRKAGSTEERLPNPSPSGETGPRTGLRAPFFGKAKALSCALALVISFLVASMVLAQTGGGYDLSWWTVDGGGATISGGGYTLSGTAGQPEPGPTLSGGDHTLLSGFWPGGGEAPACDVPLTGVSLSGPSSGQTGQTLTFTASPQPGNATAPVNYTWSSDGLISGQGTASATYRWTGAGSKSVQVTARNCGQQDFSDSQTVDVSAPGDGTCADPLPILCGQQLTGDTSGRANNLSTYSCSPWDESGPETIYTFTLAAGNNYTVSAQLSELSVDLDVFLLAAGGCDAGQCLTTDSFGSSTATAGNVAPGTYYVAVDGYQGVAGTYTLSLTCTPAVLCDHPLTGVSLSGPSSGQTGQTLTFTASPQPGNATAPVNYTWSSDGLISGQGTASATYRWTGAGSKSVQVTARNCGQQDFSDSQTVAISTPCPKPVVGVSVTGPGSGYTNADYAFAASVDPGDATTPITYTWSSHGLVSGQDTANATYRWTTTGDHTISVSVENCGGSATDQHTITLSEQPSCPNPIAGVTISGPTSGDTDVDLVFTASVQPSNATTPVDYVWSSDGLVSGQSTASATYRWNQAGDYQITVSASNCGGSKNDSHDIQIGGTYVYLPLVVRNYSE